MAEHGISRRRFMGYLIAAPTLVAGAQLLVEAARAAIRTHQPVDEYDLTDFLTQATKPTSHLITGTVNPDGTASFALTRAEVGQGTPTAAAMTIADELDIAIDKVNVTLADARSELLWNQLTGGSNTMHSIFTPVRVAAAVAKGELLRAASDELGVRVADLQTTNGIVAAPDGRQRTYGPLAPKAASVQTRAVRVQLKSTTAVAVVGQPHNRVDALDIVTGRKLFAMDLQVPHALPTMVCRPPTLNGDVKTVNNMASVRAMPGVTDVVVIPSGVAVRAQTFGQCIDAVRALRVDWADGTIGNKSERDVRAELAAAELPLTPAPPPPILAIDRTFTFSFVSNTPLETNCAIADVRADKAEIWSSLKSPIIAQQRLAQALGLSQDQVVCHVAQGGGSFGRHLFSDAAMEAALVSKAIGKPVKLMWHRTDDFRQGRLHPMATSRVRMTHLGTEVLSYDQRHTSVSTDFTHGLGELLTSTMAEAP